MINQPVYDRVASQFRAHFNRPHAVAAYAPGRIEVLGNHTDYNEGYVLSAAIQLGTFFLAAPSNSTTCRLVAGDLMREVKFDLQDVARADADIWANYVKGVFAELQSHRTVPSGFLGMFLSCLPLGSGLSSSAALEISAALALCRLYQIDLAPLSLARIGQQAEHDYAGVKSGLLDQITSLLGKANHLVMTDFRSLDISTVPLGGQASFIVCDTGVKHALIDGEYNERRAQCEAAARGFAGILDHPVSSLRDVSMAEWKQAAGRIDPAAAQRAAHPIGENERVLAGRRLLEQGDLIGFGKLMFESHESSRHYFGNSTPQLDFIVDTAARLPGALGARLTGGGFGGSAVLLVHPRDTRTVARAVAFAYNREFGRPCTTRTVIPSDGAAIMP
ncbi:MAG: galactokinase [Anaerolineales bacterium]